jgi:hypothetical protein
MKTFGVVVASILAAIVVVFLVVGVWWLGWFIKERNIEKQVDIDNHNKGTQQAWHDEAVRGVSDFNTIPADQTAARNGVKAQTCQLIARLDEPYRDDIVVSFQLQEC